MADPVANRAIAHLIVILDVAEKSMLRQPCGRPAVNALAVAGIDAVVDKGLLKRLGQLRQRAEVRVIALPLRRE